MRTIAVDLYKVEEMPEEWKDERYLLCKIKGCDRWCEMAYSLIDDEYFFITFERDTYNLEDIQYVTNPEEWEYWKRLTNNSYLCR